MGRQSLELVLLHGNDQITGSWPLALHEAIYLGSLDVQLDNLWGIGWHNPPFLGLWSIWLFSKHFLVWILLIVCGLLIGPLLVSGVEQLLEGGIAGQAGILLNLATMDQLDDGLSSWSHLQPLLTIVVDHQIVWDGYRLAIITLDGHIGLDLNGHHGCQCNYNMARWLVLSPSQ